MILIGDIHGNIKGLLHTLRTRDISGETLIQLGDFGAGMVSYASIIGLGEVLEDRHCRLLVVRGNHDDPSWFDGKKYYDRRSVRFVPDNTVVEVEGKKVLFLGGAVSIDRIARQVGRDWWPDEAFQFNPDVIRATGKVDVVVSHTSPEGVFPLHFDPMVDSYIGEDPSLIEKLPAERRRVAEALAVIRESGNPSAWYHGHFHKSHREIVEGALFACLGIGEFAYHRFESSSE